MKSLWILFALLIALSVQAQPYTVTEDGCRMFATDGSLDQSFLIERLMWVDRGSNSDQIMIFDGISALVVQDADLANYPTTDSLIEQMKVWIVECDTAGTAPGPVPLTALFANQKSIDLDGVAEYVNFGDVLDLGTTDFTFQCWFKAGASASNTQLFGKVDGTDPSWYVILNSAGAINLNVTIDVSNRFDVVTNSTAFRDNEWHHLVISVDRSTKSRWIYIDGVLESLTNNTDVGAITADLNSSADFMIGARDIGGSRLYFTGKVDEFMYFDNVVFDNAIDGTQQAKALIVRRDTTEYEWTDSLAAWYSFDSPDSNQTNGIIDRSGNGLNGTMQSGEYTDLNLCVEWPYSYQLDSNTTYSNLTPMQSSVESDSSFGGFGWSMSGVNESIVVGDNDLLSFTDGAGTDEPFSLGVFVQSNDYSSNVWPITKYKSSTDDREYSLGIISTGLIEFTLYSADGTTSIQTETTAPSAVQIYHIAATYDGSEDTSGMEIYINGELTSTVNTLTGAYSGMSNTASNFYIGLLFGASVQYSNANFNDVVVYDKELSAAEVKAIYNQHAPRNETNESIAGNIVGYWRGFNGTNVASGVLDQSGNGLNGTPSNLTDADFQYTYPRQIFDADTAGSVDFDGLADYIEIADSDSLSFTDGAGNDLSFTMSAWVNLQDATLSSIFSKYSSPNFREYYSISATSDQLAIYLQNQTTGEFIGRKTANGLMTNYENQWTHISFTYDGSEICTGIKIYVNGIQYDNACDNSAGTYTGMENTSSNLDIGLSNSLNPFDGYIAHATIMKGIELDLCQIQELYNDGSPIDPRDATFWSDDFIHYKLDQSEDLETTEGVTNISTNGSCNGTAQSMTNAANKITTNFPTN